MKKKGLIISAIVGLCILSGILAFFSVGRAGGEQEFDAVILSVDGNMITAEVTYDNASFFSTKLPDKITFDANYSGETGLKVGDTIHGNYLKGTIDGNYVRVISIVVLEQNATAPNKCLDEVAGNITFYEESVKEAQTSGGIVTVRLSRDLNEEQADRLKNILDDEDEWVDDHSVDRLAYYFDGDFELSDREHKYYFTYEYNVIYYDHYFAKIPTEDMQYIKDLGSVSDELPDIEPTKYTNYYNIGEQVELCDGSTNEKSTVTVTFKSTEGPSAFSVEVWHRASENDEWTKSEAKSALIGDAPSFSVPATSEFAVKVTATEGNKGNVTFLVACS